MSEEHISEVEKTLLYISEARQRAAKAREALERSGGALHLISALRDSEEALAAEHRRLMQTTYFASPDASPDDQKRLAV